MTFKIDDLSRDSERIGHFIYADGIDRDGNECMMVIRYDGSSSGCNPYHWDSSPYQRFGHEFLTREEALHQAMYARGSWSVKSVDKDTIKVAAYRFKSTLTVESIEE